MLITILFFASHLLSVNSHDEVRNLLDQAIVDGAKANDLIEYSINSKLPKDYALAYKGMGLFMQSKYASSTLDKYTLFKEGEESLEGALKISPNNIEFIYLRYTIQTHTPFILGYDDNIENDRIKLRAYLDNTSNKSENEWLFSKVAEYLIVY